jgi:PTH1 family peptidyl-tRNA hydrolase
LTVKLIVGLGNPGIEYQFTPHNVGFLVADRIADRAGIRVSNRFCRALTGRGRFGGEEVVIAKPETFMNLSGEAVGALVAELAIEAPRDLIVILDELALPLGSIRVRERGSSAGHNGAKSVIGALQSQEFLRIRLGIDPGHKVGNAADYVLTPFRKAQLGLVDQALEEAADAVEMILTKGAAAAMSRYNVRAAQQEPGSQPG